ncbi:MAG: protein kinase, partial [Gemmataceae bacterium]|nr:protein kinase [Gemmataceae bacterium]
MDAPFSCPNPQCSQRLSLASLPPGQKVRCPGCGTVFVVPSPTTDFSQSKGSVPAPPPSPPPSLPATIGPYQVRGKLGQGAFGVVYRAHDPAMERDVAIKMLNATAVKNQKYLDRFLREARVVGQMLHGNIVPVYQLGRLGQDYYIVSAFIPGRPLEAAVPEHGMDPPQAVRLVIQLLEALAYAHERGVFHRDVKPANAMLDDKGTLYLMDFGLAGLLDQDSHRMTQDGSVMGTPAYMAPEQAKGQVELVGPAADQYSAGMVLYELLTGRLAFEAPSLPALLYQVLEAPPPPPSRLRPGLDPALEALCLRTLAKTPQ